MFKFQTLYRQPERLLWLIIVSLLLLGISQVLWIKKIWEEQKSALQQETNYIFQKTVISLQDSLVRRAMVKSGLDAKESLPLPVDGRIFERKLWRDHEASQKMRWESGLRVRKSMADDLQDSVCREERTVQITVVTTDSQPSGLQSGLGRFLLNFRSDSTMPKPDELVIDFQGDTISRDELQQSYTRALNDASLPNSFMLRMAHNPGALRDSGLMATDAIPAGFMRHQFSQAVFEDYQAYLIKKVLPYGLFSLLLLGMISLAFWLIFNSLQQQNRLSRQKNEFISNVTHELKTPLTTVGVAMEALNDFEVLKSPERTKEYLNISKVELERLNLLVEKVLRLSMFEQQALKLQLTTLDLSEVCQQVINAMTLQASNLKATISFHKSGDSFLVKGDKLHLTGVVYNLLDNALKYSRENPEIEVSISTQVIENQHFVKVSVRDNGIGIPEEYQQEVFDKFFRVPVGNTHNVKGHGLGLSYVSQVLQEHRGSIRLQSSPGNGSTFIVEIPALISQQNA
ncbi:MAG: HAMP domain-containing sensor histidine kinase [Saprospiraceae bacterium]